jgi:biotin carboxyl carrier protein
LENSSLKVLNILEQRLIRRIKMKKYYVTVNGNRYEVEVEEINEDFQGNISAPVSSAVPTVEPIQAKEAPKPAAAPKQVSSSVPTGGEKISCPMPGTIVGINVKEGTSVKKGDLLFILEAMKMENEIVSPVDGVVASIAVTKGQTVNTEDLLAVIE